jgi:hypothetical protein
VSTIRERKPGRRPCHQVGGLIRRLPSIDDRLGLPLGRVRYFWLRHLSLRERLIGSPRVLVVFSGFWGMVLVSSRNKGLETRRLPLPTYLLVVGGNCFFRRRDMTGGVASLL